MKSRRAPCFHGSARFGLANASTRRPRMHLTRGGAGSFFLWLKGLHMTLWRMAFRAGNQGRSLWPECRRLGVAAITYEPLEKVDLSKHPKGEPRSMWARLTATQNASLRRLAYEMESGDVIYVKEGPKIVGKGFVTGPYTFDSEFRIVDPNGFAWPHQVPVDWLPDFPEASVLLGAEQLTVKQLTAADVKRIESAASSAIRLYQ